MSAWSLDFCQSFFAALGAEVEEIGVGLGLYKLTQ